MNSYEEPWMSGQRPRDIQADDFGFSEVDDFLTQTLSSLQDLDIPVGEPSQQQFQYGSSYTPQKGHKKQPSGTAIFGFAQHNKSLSIPGVTISHDKKPSVAKPVVAPQQVFQQEHNQPVRQEPVLFQNAQDFRNMHMNLYADYSKQGSQMYQDVYPPQAPQQMMSQPVPVQSQPQQQQSEDYIVTKQTPSAYKFPPDPPTGRASQHNYQSHHHHNPRQPPIGPIPQHALPHQQSQYMYGSMPPQQPQQHHMNQMPSVQQQTQQGSPQKTVQVPVEYLQKLTKMIKDTNGVDMDSFMNYEFDKIENNARPDLVPSSPQRPPSDISPTLNTYQGSSDTTNSSKPQTREPTPEISQFPNTFQASPVRNNDMHQMVTTLSSPIKPAKFIHAKNSIGLEQQNPESNTHLPAPKTPSPTLESQAKFVSSPVKPANLSWSPVVITVDKVSRGPVIKKKTHDKVSTLPPGEIDQYVIGPREDKTFICNYNGCGKLFTRRYNVRSHVQTHLSDRPFICEAPGCNKAFVRQHDLTRHKKIHQELGFQCACKKKFGRHDALFRHRLRNICSGGLDPREAAKYDMRQARTSVQKKKVERPNIRIANDTVAKKLEFDLLKCKKKTVSAPSSPQQSRTVSGASTVTADDDEDGDELEDGEIRDDEDGNDSSIDDLFEDHDDDDDEGGDDDVDQRNRDEENHGLQIMPKDTRDPTPTPGLGLLSEFTQGISDDEDNVFLDNLGFDEFDLRPSQT